VGNEMKQVTAHSDRERLSKSRSSKWKSSFTTEQFFHQSM